MARIIALENYATSIGVSKEMLKNDKAIEIIEYHKKFFIAIKNNSGGYAMNNIFSKECCGENDITTIGMNKKYPTMLVEDMFAYLLHKQHHEKFNYIILNSIANKDKLEKKLADSNEKNVIIQLKDDAIGRSLTLEISNSLNNSVNKNQQYQVNKREVEQVPNSLKSISKMKHNNKKDKRKHQGLHKF